MTGSDTHPISKARTTLSSCLQYYQLLELYRYMMFMFKPQAMLQSQLEGTYFDQKLERMIQFKIKK